MDDADLQKLPPLKRFRLMQQQQELKNKESRDSTAAMSCLPAKKRKQSMYPPISTESESKGNNSVSAYCLPAKKRVWALQPDLISSSSDLDLNVEWKPSFNEKSEFDDNPVVESIIPPQKVEENAENGNLGSNKDKVESREEEEIDNAASAADNDDDDGIVCAICQSTDGDSSDPIVLCDGCDLMVHSTCYGNPLVKGIPEGDWFCAQCLASKSETPKVSHSCCLCPVNGGAMKPTNNKDGSWAHIVCSVFVPEVFFEDPEGREGIDCSNVPRLRWEKKCYVCRSKKGCAIECSESKCPLWFHVGCGLNEDLSIEYREGRNGKDVVAGFCKDHTELWKKQQKTGKFKIVAKEEIKK